MADVAAAPPDTFPPNDHLIPPSRLDHSYSPSRSHEDVTRASSADNDDKNDAHDDAIGRPSGTASGASSVTGANGGGSSLGGSGSFIQPLTAKKGPQSFFSGSKIKHLKKADGIPLWRVDIQYEFLRAVFKDQQPVFTNSYTREKGCTFADIYVDAMARSSKTSKILRDKLMTERENALNMAMVCLLVNVGRMNTTLNFFPEMKAQLRTYHAIPSLQAHTDSNAYKQLQDAPRLKSILKGACEDRAEPQTLDQILGMPVPRTNPINLVFILSTYAPRVSETHFPDNMDFYDLVMRTTLSSKSRAKAFLWLVWLYLESNFTEQECFLNPFGHGKPNREKTKACCVPDFEYLTEEQAAFENVDTAEETAFGEVKQEERKRLIGEIQSAPGTGRGRGRKSLAPGASPDVLSPAGSPPRRGGGRPRQSYPTDMYDYESDSRTRSASPENPYTPASKNGRRISNLVKMPNILNDAVSPSDSPKPKRSRTSGSVKRTADGELKPAQRIVLMKGGRPLATPDNVYSSRASDRSSPVFERTGVRQRMTSHQIAVQQNRKDRVYHVIDRKLRRIDRRRRKARMKEGAISRAWQRIRDLEEPLWMSDDEEHPLRHTHHPEYDEHGNLVERKEEEEEPHPHSTKRTKADKSHKAGVNGLSYAPGPAGLVPRKEEEMGEGDDFGEEAISIAAALRRTARRLERWEAVDNRRLAEGLALVGEQQEGTDRDDEVMRDEEMAEVEDVEME